MIDIPPFLEPLLVSLFFASLGIIIKIFRSIKGLQELNTNDGRWMIIQTLVYGWIGAILIFVLGIFDGNVPSTLVNYAIIGYAGKTVIDGLFGSEDSLRSWITGKLSSKSKNGE